ncbi:MAG: TraB/GumN family protein [Calditrichaeota bacterium]|nr:MAG: TraB family protein [Calditrichota bacterium]MBL1205393.1 TraB/GumN family protein [Calditrichota bacterium]NOG45222.1 TraB/GumN family protein [Calditrichota bacterium]
MNETERDYGSDVEIVNVDGREYIIVGTAHISQQSADLVRKVIENEKPDTVCVELDQQRYKALREQKKWENLDLKTVTRQKQLATLLINLLLSSYQKRLGKKLGVMPGVELLEATKVADEHKIPVELCDRDVRITMRRAWNSLSFFKKMQLMTSGAAGAFTDQEISEEQLAEIRKKDVLNEMMNELGEAMPVLKTVLIDERDSYITQKMTESKGDKIVSVVGAGHMGGIKEGLLNNKKTNLEEIEQIPPASSVAKIIGWAIPIIIIASIFYIGYDKGLAQAGDNALFWFLANGIPSALGVLIALGHPFAVLSAFVGAPFTSLTPLIGAGYVAAFVQAYFKPPLVHEFRSVMDDAGEVKKWWANKVLRVFLVFILSSLGSVLGTYVGAYEIISNLF